MLLLTFLLPVPRCILPHCHPAASICQLIVVFKPGATKQQTGKALSKGNAAKKKLLRRGDDASGDVTLVTVRINPGQSSRDQLRAAAALLNDGERSTRVQWLGSLPDRQ